MLKSQLHLGTSVFDLSSSTFLCCEHPSTQLDLLHGEFFFYHMTVGCIFVILIFKCNGNVSCFQVALVYHVDDPINFMTSFYGCLIAGIIPVPIEPPASKDVSSNLFLPYLKSFLLPFIVFFFTLKKKNYQTSQSVYAMHFSHKTRTFPTNFGSTR